MNTLDFQARAALYLGSDWHTASAQGARNFRTAAQAILFAIEHAAPVSLHGARLVTGDITYSGDQLAGLYRRSDFPLPRRIDAGKPRTAWRKLLDGRVNPGAYRTRRPGRRPTLAFA